MGSAEFNALACL